MLAFVFPGQNSQHVGMGRDLYDNCPPAREVMDAAGRTLDVDLLSLMFEGPEERLMPTDIQQPAILTHSLGALVAVRDRGLEPDIVAGHSLGEYSALVAAEVLTVEEVVPLVRFRAQLMTETAERRPGAMSAILGLDAADVESIVQRAGQEGTCCLANYNCPGQLIISGSAPAVERAEQLASEGGAKRVVRLKVSGAFHSPLMAPAAEKFMERLGDVVAVCWLVASRLWTGGFKLELKDQVAIITGAGGGIGTAIALALAEAGANVVINDVVAETAEAVAKQVQERGVKALVNGANITDAEQVQAMVDTVTAELGRIDILVNNAGITRDGLLVRMDEGAWDLVLDVNLKGAFLCTKAAARPMMKQRYGRIINIASVAGVAGNVGQANYSASKGGLIALTKTAAQELAGRNITANALAPGFIDTAMTRQLPEEARKGWLARIPLARPGIAEDVAEAVLFFAGPGAAYITGQVLNVDGGLIM